MSPQRWLLSVLLLYHLIAVGVDAIPAPEKLNAVDSRPRHPAGDAISAALTPGFDRAALALARIEPAIYATAAPLRRLTRPYVDAGLRQTWNMFTDAVREDHYLRLDYYVSGPQAGVPRRIQELVFPLGREDDVRALHDFRDKAVVNLLIKLSEAQTNDDPPEDPSRTLVPIVRYFRERFRRDHLADGAGRLTRTEVWHGFVPIPPPGDRLPAAVRQSRLDALTRYYGGPVPTVLGATNRHALQSIERESDITWKLEFVEDEP